MYAYTHVRMCTCTHCVHCVHMRMYARTYVRMYASTHSCMGHGGDMRGGMVAYGALSTRAPITFIAAVVSPFVYTDTHARTRMPSVIYA